MQQRTKQPETHRLILSISGVYASVERLLDYLSKKYRVLSVTSPPFRHFWGTSLIQSLLLITAHCYSFNPKANGNLR